MKITPDYFRDFHFRDWRVDTASVFASKVLSSAWETPLPRREQTLELATDAVESAKAPGLRYVSDTQAGIRRKRAGKGFYYEHPKRKRRREKQTLPPITSPVT